METRQFDIAPGINISPVSVSHANALSRLVRENIAHLGKYLPAVTQLASVEDAGAYLEGAAKAAAEGDRLEWHIFEHDVLCGSVRVKDIETTDRTASVGYFIGESYQGRGIVTSSVHAVIRYCFGQLGLNRLELKCAATNLPSRRMAERLGFSREGLLRQSEYLDGAFVDHCLYALLREEFEAAAPFDGNKKKL